MRLNEHDASPTFELLKSERDVPEIRFSKKAIMQQEEYVAQSPAEVGWMGYVTKISDLVYEVTETFLLPQEVTGVTTQIDPEIWFKLDEEVPQEKLKTIRFWGHSHVNMGVVASGTDADTMKTLALGTDWFIRAILNKKGEMKVSFFNYQEGVAFHDCPWTLPEDKERAELRASVAKDLEEKVRKESAKLITVNTYGTKLPGGILDHKGEKSPVVARESYGKMWDYDLEKFVEVKSPGHFKHLTGRMGAWRKANGQDEVKIPEELISEWFNGKDGSLIKGT